MSRVTVLLVALLSVGGCTVTTLKCPPGIALEPPDKLRAAELYRRLSPEDRASLAPLIKRQDRNERVCGALAGIK
jgi:hypothetical protein